MCKPDMVVCICNLSTLKMEADGFEVQGHIQLHSEFKTMPYDMGHLSQNNKNDNKRK